MPVFETAFRTSGRTRAPAEPPRRWTCGEAQCPGIAKSHLRAAIRPPDEDLAFAGNRRIADVTMINPSSAFTGE